MLIADVGHFHLGLQLFFLNKGCGCFAHPEKMIDISLSCNQFLHHNQEEIINSCLSPPSVIGRFCFFYIHSICYISKDNICVGA